MELSNGEDSTQTIEGSAMDKLKLGRVFNFRRYLVIALTTSNAQLIEENTTQTTFRFPHISFRAPRLCSFYSFLQGILIKG
jgi:hypothetical protein